MFKGIGWDIVLGLGAAALWIVLAVIIGFTNMLAGMLSRWRTRVAAIYDNFKVETKLDTPNYYRQVAYRLDLAEYERSYKGYDKRQSDIRVCMLEAAERRCALAATESLAVWVRDILVELEKRDLKKEKDSFVDSLLGILAKGQEILLKQGPVP